MSVMIQYISYEEVLDVYHKTITKSGGGLEGVRDKEAILAILEFIQNDDYYPSYADKLAYLVFRFCSGHFFIDGNKRLSLTLGAYFLHKNGSYWEACVFMSKMESIVYHIAASHIDQELLGEIICCFLAREEYDENLQLKIALAMSMGDLGISENNEL